MEMHRGLVFFIIAFAVLQNSVSVDGRRKWKSSQEDVNLLYGNRRTGPVKAEQVGVFYNGTQICAINPEGLGLWKGLLSANLKTLDSRLRHKRGKKGKDRKRNKKGKYSSSSQSDESFESDEYNVYDQGMRQDVMGLLNEQKELYETLLDEAKKRDGFVPKKADKYRELTKSDKVLRKYVREYKDAEKKVQLYRNLECEGKLNQALYRNFSNYVDDKYGTMLQDIEGDYSGEGRSANKILKETNRMMKENGKDIARVAKLRKYYENQRNRLEGKLNYYLGKKKDRNFSDREGQKKKDGEKLLKKLEKEENDVKYKEKKESFENKLKSKESSENEITTTPKMVEEKLENVNILGEFKRK